MGENKKQILIVEDDNDLRSIIASRLINAGYQVHRAESGKGAMDICDNHDIYLVITDIIMPEVDGLESIREFKKKYPSIKIIAISGKEDIYLKIAVELGADFSYRKPFDVVDLISTVSTVLKK